VIHVLAVHTGRPAGTVRLYPRRDRVSGWATGSQCWRSSERRTSAPRWCSAPWQQRVHAAGGW